MARANSVALGLSHAHGPKPEARAGITTWLSILRSPAAGLHNRKIH
jgi:hypothetical protein